MNIDHAVEFYKKHLISLMWKWDRGTRMSLQGMHWNQTKKHRKKAPLQCHYLNIVLSNSEHYFTNINEEPIIKTGTLTN